jgi:hypothetical protein
LLVLDSFIPISCRFSAQNLTPCPSPTGRGEPESPEGEALFGIALVPPPSLGEGDRGRGRYANNRYETSTKYNYLNRLVISQAVYTREMAYDQSQLE